MSNNARTVLEWNVRFKTGGVTHYVVGYGDDDDAIMTQDEAERWAARVRADAPASQVTDVEVVCREVVIGAWCTPRYT